MARPILLISALLAVLAGPLRAQGDQATVEAIRSLEASMIQAMTARDFATLDRLLAPDFVATDRNGRRLSRVGYLAIFRQPDPILLSLLADPDTVLTRGDAAVHLGSGIETVTRRDGSITRFRQVWTDTWVRQPDGSWQCLASQWTELPAP
jgi:ketosteroid isomerase-like protein